MAKWCSDTPFQILIYLNTARHEKSQPYIHINDSIKITQSVCFTQFMDNLRWLNRKSQIYLQSSVRNQCHLDNIVQHQRFSSTGSTWQFTDRVLGDMWGENSWTNFTHFTTCSSSFSNFHPLSSMKQYLSTTDQCILILHHTYISFLICLILIFPLLLWYTFLENNLYYQYDYFSMFMQYQSTK